ncbi:MAG: hypothetical protein Q9218_004332 [Villophora microphyllina]
MDEVAPEYDVVVLGTGLTECVLSGVMSVKGKKVLHIDRNDHYGGEAASVNIESLFRKYGNYSKGEEPWKKYGRVNDWNIDLVPKLLMSNGELTNILVSTDVTRYLEFKQIAGSYVQQGNGAKATVAKVPSDASEALRSPLMGLFEKRRAKKFLEWVGAFKEDDPASYGGLNLNQCTMKEVYDKFGLEATTRDFIGHSMALYQTDEYMMQKGAAKETVLRIRLYVNSMARYGKSPYIYPLYGLGELPQGFARLSAIYGGTYMLNTSIDEVEYEGGRVSGIKATMRERGEDSEGTKFSTKTKMIIADPSYFPGKVQVVGKLLKAICILNHPVANTDNSDSAQLIIPQSQVGRKNDIYIAIVSSAHNVCPKGYYIAIISTIAEGSSNHHLELQPGFERLGKIEEKFMGAPIPLYEPLESGTNDNIFISKSYDATSHFETTTDDVRDIYRRAQKEELVVEGLREGTNLVGEESAAVMAPPTPQPTPDPGSTKPPKLEPNVNSSSATKVVPATLTTAKAPRTTVVQPVTKANPPIQKQQMPPAKIPTAGNPPSFSSLLTSDMVEFYLGPKRKAFTIHRNLICSTSTIFNAHFGTLDTKDPIKTMYLPQHDPSVFELFIDFLYRGSFANLIPLSPPPPDPLNGNTPVTNVTIQMNQHETTVGKLLGLYIMGSDWNIPILRNHTLDFLQQYLSLNSTYFSATQIQHIYSTPSSSPSPLRRFAVDHFIYLFMKKSVPADKRRKLLSNRVNNGEGGLGIGFLLDVNEAMVATKKYPSPPDPGTKGRCCYHEHFDGKMCAM